MPLNGVLTALVWFLQHLGSFGQADGMLISPQRSTTPQKLKNRHVSALLIVAAKSKPRNGETELADHLAIFPQGISPARP